jgi:lysozyme family protein
MADFEKAYQRTQIFEKGYQCHEDDNGNWTGGKKGIGFLVGTIDGITANEVMQYLGHVPTVQEVKNFSESARKSIYEKKYWDKSRLNEIKDQHIANLIYDENVNAGNGRIVSAQKAAGLTITGTMNDETINYFNTLV